jgi:hypothetical protein
VSRLEALTRLGAATLLVFLLVAAYGGTWGVIEGKPDG